MNSYFLLQQPKASAWPWLTQNPITQPHGVNGEMGVDFGMPTGTPITALFGGTVAGAFYYGGGGVVSLRFNYRGRPAVFYYQHLDLIADHIVPGYSLRPGEVLGWSGGQLAGGHHPSTPQFSSGPHIEVGINPPWGGGWNPDSYGPNVDPEPFLRTIAQGLPGAGFGGASQAVAWSVSNATTPKGFAPIAGAVADALAISPLPIGDANPLDAVGIAVGNTGAFFGRALIAGVGFVLVIGVALYLLREPLETVQDRGAQAMQVAALAGGV